LGILLSDIDPNALDWSATILCRKILYCNLLDAYDMS